MTDVFGIGIDWGSSNLRAWAFAPDGTVVSKRAVAVRLDEARAMGFEVCLSNLIAPMGVPDRTLKLACGMVGAAGGWQQAPYAECPAKASSLLSAPIAGPVPDLFLLPGLSTAAPPTDVMRGEETQICGAARLGHEGVFCLPGTHSKWVQTVAGTIIGFRTHVTGELFAAAREHTIFGQLTEDGEPDFQAFDEGVKAAAHTPLTNLLFQARSRVLAGQMDGKASTWFLSGGLIGYEALSANPELARTTLIAVGRLGQLYARAFSNLSLPFTVLSAEICTTSALFRGLQELQARHK